jgi:hypothetical protein
MNTAAFERRCIRTGFVALLAGCGASTLSVPQHMQTF